MYDLYHGDCLEIMKNVSEHSIDLIFPDDAIQSQ